MTEREIEFFRDEILKETNKKIEKMERDIDLLKQEHNKAVHVFKKRINEIIAWINRRIKD